MSADAERISLNARSKLEELLESIRNRDDRPKDKPPVLPTRPISKGRLPTAKRLSPGDIPIRINSHAPVTNGPSTDNHLKIKETAFTCWILGNKGTTAVLSEESPYDICFANVDAFKQDTSQENGNDGFNSIGSPLPLSAVPFKKLRVWCSLTSAKWKLGNIQFISGQNAHVSFSDGKTLSVSTENILPANPDTPNDVDDLIRLGYLNEPSVLHNLQNRYSRDTIYTKAGLVLVAVNPFKRLLLYGKDYIHAYQHKLKDAPHVYAVSDNAFTAMMKDEANQSIIISGESGAGKTETAKFAMEYLADLGAGNGIENQVLQANAILEAFGNARTSMNSNSSRFGKLIEMHFSEIGKICGANIQTFLLEKLRVVQRATGERSYHIFYQLCAGAPTHLREHLNLKMAEHYKYLTQSDCLMIDGIDDAQSFHTLLEALDNIQLLKEDQYNLFAMIAAILWLGNISFSVIDSENHVQIEVDEGIISASKLLGCNEQELILALSTQKIQTGQYSTVKKLTLSQAIETRDALARSIYYSLFDWLVEHINRSLGVGNAEITGRSICILDICGFEYFHKNSFEQLCINYANERLQQHFNRHLFKLEQEEYMQDGIDWTQVEIVDNTQCLNLFEKRPLGLLSLLDEESTFPSATDLTFVSKLKKHLNENPCFKEKDGAFGVCHYAGQVWYNTDGFLEKNRDPLHSDSIHLLLSSSQEFPKLLGSNILDKSQKKLPSSSGALVCVDSQNQCVGRQIKDQMFKLMQKLEKTTPHFICCIKPNNEQSSGLYEHDLVLQQLRCYGVLEMAKISRSSFSTRMTHEEFAGRYGFLVNKTIASQYPLSVSLAVLQRFNVPPNMFQVGYTKLFLRAGLISALEDSRNQTLQKMSVSQQYKIGATSSQSYNISRDEFELSRKRFRAAITIQKYAKRQIAQRAFADRRGAAVHMQSVIRGWVGRKRVLPESTVSDSNNENPQVHPSVLADLRKELCLEYETKIKYMEEMCQAQIMALQTSLAAAKKGLAAGGCDMKQQNIKFRLAEEDSIFAGNNAASKPPQRDGGATNHAVSHVLREFEETKQVFEDAQYLVDVNSGQRHANMNSDEEFRKLKKRFCTWNKDYVKRLEATKKTLRQLRNKEGEVENKGSWKKWWSKKFTGPNSRSKPLLRRKQ